MSKTFFDAKFREGRLDILASEKKRSLPGVTDFQLWFMFDNKAHAQKAFVKLSKKFEVLSKSKKVFEKNAKNVAEYSDQLRIEDTNSVQLILAKDELYDNKYKLFFRIGSFTYSK